MLSFRFPKRARLRTSKDFSDVFQQNTGKIRATGLLILYKKNTFNHPRIGIAVPKRIVRHAVNRNKFKRIIRESVRQQITEFSAIDIVILVKEDANSLNKKEFRQNLEKVWEKLITRCNTSSSA